MADLALLMLQVFDADIENLLYVIIVKTVINDLAFATISDETSSFQEAKLVGNSRL
jgi:hypothetical protein